MNKKVISETPLEEQPKNILLIMDDDNYLVIKEANSFLEQLKGTMDKDKDKLYSRAQFPDIIEGYPKDGSPEMESTVETLNAEYNGVLFLNSEKHKLDDNLFSDAHKVFEENKDMDSEIDELFGSKENFQAEIAKKFKGGFPKQKPFVREQPKISNNSSCPCGSGKKYKKCCKNDKKFDPITGKHTEEHNKFEPAQAPSDGSTGLDF